MSQPPYQQPAMGQLVLNMRKPFGLLSASMISPRATIDGHPAPVRWEQNAFPVTAGTHQVHLSSNYIWEYGGADLAVDVAPGSTVEVHYSSPLITFMKGRAGYTLQPRPGMVVFWIILAVPFVLVLSVLIAAFAGS